VRLIALAIMSGFDQVALAIRPHDLDEFGIAVRVILGFALLAFLVTGK